MSRGCRLPGRSPFRLARCGAAIRGGGIESHGRGCGLVGLVDRHLLEFSWQQAKQRITPSTERAARQTKVCAKSIRLDEMWISVE